MVLPRRTIVVVTCLLVFTAFAVLVLSKPITQDEGVFLTIGKAINQGAVPYRDFFDHKPPAIHFLYAGLFQIFGTSVWVIKIALIIGIAVAAGLLWKIAEVLKPRTGWYAAGIFLFLLTQFEGYFLIAEPFLLMPLLLALWVVLRWPLCRRWFVLAGLLLGLVMLFKQTAVLSVLPVLVLAWRNSKKGFIAVTAGMVVPLAALGVYLLAKGVWAEAWHQVVTLTLTKYPREPLDFILQSLKINFIWTSPVWMLALLGGFFMTVKRNYLLALILVPLPFLFFRHYPHYWVQILPFVALLAAAALTDMRSRLMKFGVLIFCVAIAGGKVSQDAMPNYRILQAQFFVAEELGRESAHFLLAENQFTAFYFLLPQRPLNRYLYITEITNAEGAEDKTSADIKSTRKVLVLWPKDPNFAYAKELQKFIDKNGETIKEYTELGLRTVVIN